MTLIKEKKQEILRNNRRHEKDTGSSEVQIALLTERINDLTENHFKTRKKDHHSGRGLMKMVNRRKKLLKYLQENDLPKYKELIKKLNLRK
jgi:small subunit ribosomal protein S15